MAKRLPQTDPVPGLTRDLPVKRRCSGEEEAPDQVRGGVSTEGKGPRP